jgi:hypothetical protein
MSDDNVMKMEVELPPNLELIYSNFAIISHTPSEVMMDLIQLLPNTPKAKVAGRVLMTPLSAKLFLNALTENVAKYEAQFGPITIPTGLADQLFRPPST